MMRNQVTDQMQRYYALPNPNLRSYLARQQKGVTQIVHTPWLPDTTDDSYLLKVASEILDEWNSELESVRSDWPSLYDFEMDMRSKVGPLSVQKPLTERLEAIQKYFDYADGSHYDAIDSNAVHHMQEEFARVKGIRVRSVDNVVAHMKLSTNSGSPYFTKRRNAIAKTIPFTIRRRSGEYEYTDQSGTWELTATLGWRGQEGGMSAEDTKQRVLWMFPMAANVVEAQFYQPFIEACQRFNLVPPWNGTESVDVSVTKLFDTKASEDLVVCTDFSAFDEHFNTRMQECATSVYSSVLTKDQLSEQWLNEVFGLKYDLPICTSWGEFFKGKHAMSSGSGGTNCDETVAHRCLQWEAALHHGVKLNTNSMCLGDDGLLTYPGITVEEVVNDYRRHGMEMNESKQYASTDDCIFLRHWHSTEYRIGGICVGVYPTMRALGRLLFQERFHDPEVWGAKAVTMRALSIIENCRYHPKRDAFLSFCIAKDKFRLGLDIPGFLDNINSYYAEAKANDALFISYTQEYGNQRPASDWWVTNELKKLH